MPIVPRVGRKSWPVATFLTVCYILLTLGGISMVIPFLIMLSSAVGNSWDYEQYNVVPVYVFDRQQRYMKVLAEKYLDIDSPRWKFRRDYRLFSAGYRPDPHWTSFRAMREDETFFDKPPFLFGSEKGREEQLQQVRKDYLEWVASLDDPMLTLPLFGRFISVEYRQFMRHKYEQQVLGQPGIDRDAMSGRALEKAALACMAEAWQEAKFTGFIHLQLMNETTYPYHLRIWLPALDEQRNQDYLEFVRSLPGDWKTPITARHLWLRFLDNAAGSLEQFRKETGLEIDAYNDLSFPEREPDNPVLAKLWRTFVREKWPLWMVRLPAEQADVYHAYLKKRARTLERFNGLVKGHYTSWGDVPYTGRTPIVPLERNFWRDFLNQLPAEELIQHRVYPERSYRAFLQKRYGSDVGAVNQAYGWDAASYDEIGVPLAEVDYAQFLDQENWFLKKFVTFNYVQVFSFMAVQGRAVFNTFVLVALTILCTLTVNPLAAYALSRFQMKSTHKILLFLLATMAFPHEVSMIPNFLLLRELGFLNTFAALVLPGLANGFGIFLLKGFFDSLPTELYEAATIDGANEFTMFARITLPLCKPILAYQALLAFIASYGGFMWAFLVCQEKHMWTIMVWMYQYQQSASAFPYMIMSAFVLASIPTLLVFLFCQKIILRGIIIPTMK
jgi:ABC-type glycerol-3-phosphate transport system permease component